jgi:hypothetical protein
MSASDLKFQDWLDRLMFENRTPEEQAMWEYLLEDHLQSLSEEKLELLPPLPDRVFVEDKDELPSPLPALAFGDVKDPRC